MSRVSGGLAPAGSSALPSYNFVPASGIGWRRGLNAMLNGTRPARILCVGDSTTRGFGDTVDAKGFPADLASDLVGRGFSTARGLNIPEFQRGAQAADPRIAYGAGWTSANLAGFMWGGTGPYWAAASAAAGNLVFTPGTNADTFDVYYLTEPGTSGFTITATGGGGDVRPAGLAAAIVKRTVNAAALAANNTLTISAVGAGSGAFIIGVEAYNRTTPQVLVGNCGVNGATAASWVNEANAPVGPLECIAAYGPDLSVITLGVNDANLGITTAAYRANLATLAAACASAGGSVILCAPVPESNANAGYLTLAAYAAAVQALAYQAGYMMVDMLNRWGGAAGGFAVYNGKGWYFDTVHPDPAGYQDWATTLATALDNF